jgi:arylsulfatase A-like enzyme
MRSTRIALIAVVVTSFLPIGMLHAAEAKSNAARKPNILFILADDIGYGDFSCYGATRVKTPHIDRLARQGVRFTDAHSTGSVCTPTRYAFITGQYAWRNPAGSSILSGEAPLAIDTAKPSTASVLHDAGYATGIVGKWHIGLGTGDINWNTDIKPGPLELGFDRAFFYPATNDRVPCVFIENHRVVGLDPNDPIRTSYKGKVGNDPTGLENPELLTLKPSHGHDNTIVNGISRIGFMSGGKSARWKDEEMADMLTKQAVAFIEKNQSKPFFLYFATHNIHVPRVPHPRHRGTSGCGTRGDFIQEFDACVGTVLATLERLKLADNTLVIVTSDNGGVMDDGYDAEDLRNTNGHLCNGALRGYKGSLWEGGHRVPFIARWPGKIQPASESTQLIGLVDMLATFAAVAGQKVPQGGGPDSINVLPAILGQAGDRPVRDHLVVQANGVARLAIRQGNWKFIPPGPRRPAAKAKAKDQAVGELYDLSNDLSESTNVAKQHPEVAAKLAGVLAKERAAGK